MSKKTEWIIIGSSSVLSIVFMIWIIALVVRVPYVEDDVAKIHAEGVEKKQQNLNIEDIFSPSGEDALVIPIPNGVLERDCLLKWNGSEKMISLTINGVSKEFYADHFISGKKEQLNNGSYIGDGEVTTFFLEMKEVYEVAMTYDQNQIELEFVRPSELFEKIVVIDPGHGGNDNGIIANGAKEKDIILTVAIKVKEYLENDHIKAYMTRETDLEVSEEKRVEFVNNCQGDFLVSIHCGEGEREDSKYGIATYYNEEYFIPEYGNFQLADAIELEVTKNAATKALGIYPQTEGDFLLNNAKIPAARVEIGYLTNEQEARLLEDEEYLNKIAIGIYQAICSAYSKMEGE